MSDELEALERMMDRLRVAVRRAKIAGEHGHAKELRAELRKAERQWAAAVDELEENPRQAAGSAAIAGADRAGPGTERTGARRASADEESTAPAAGDEAPGPTPSAQPSRLAGRAAALPAREQVHQVLTLLGAPAAPALIVAVHGALYAGPMASSRLGSSRLTSLRRDEERSFRAAPYARPYYLCAALTADLLSPARGLLAVSTWPMDVRIIGPLSPRVDYLTAAIAVAGRLEQAGPTPEARRLLWRFAENIPQAATSMRSMTPAGVASAARAELAVHRDADASQRAAAAARAREQLDDVAQLFGTSLGLSHRTDHAG